MQNIRVFLRLIGTLVFIPFGIFLGIIFAAWYNPYAKHVITIERWWVLAFVRMLGFKIKVEGEPKKEGHLATINHISWIDPILLSSTKIRSYLVKAEVQDWPIIGTLVKMVGCLFIKRGKGQVYERIDQISDIINNGNSVGVFPEATTSDGSHVIPFTPLLYQVVTKKGCPLQVAGIFYPNPNGKGVNPSVPFIGEQSFVENLISITKNKRTEVIIKYFDLEPLEGETSEALAARCHDVVEQWILSFQ